MPQSSRQNEDKLIDPRSTRLSRQQAARGTEEQGTLCTEGILNTVPPENDAQEIFDSRDCVEPVASGNNHSFFPHSLSVSAPDFLESQSGGNVQHLLEIGVYDDAMYNDDVNEVTCMERNICKRISNAGQEWSAGRPGNRPMIIGARTAARNSDTCLGPYATRAIPSPSTDHNNRAEEQASLTTGRHQGTIQTTASSSRISTATEDHASLATVALHPRKPPYFCGGRDEDVHVWTSIVDRWLNAVQGEPLTQLAYIVSLLRGAAFEWYSSMETRTGCPGDWTTLCHAMLERFGSSIRSKKAYAALMQLTQDKMTVLEYFDAFESFLAQIENYDESFYTTKFIFGLHPSILTHVFMQHPATLLEAKGIAEELELTQMMVKSHPVEKKTIKTAQNGDTQERRSGKLFQSVQGKVQRRTQKKAYSYRDRGQNTDSFGKSCKSAHSGAKEISCPERYGPAAVWRSLLKDLPQGDRAGHVRRQGSVVMIDLEALTRERRNRLSADTTVATMSMHTPSGRPRATRVYIRNRLLRRDRERQTRDRVRERRYVTNLLETLVSPMGGGTESCGGVTTSRL